MLNRRKIKNRKTNELYLKGRFFYLNFGLGNEVSSRDIISLCRHSFQRLFGIGYQKIDNIKRNYITNTDYSHGLKNTLGSRTLAIDDAINSISEFLNELKKEEGEVHASRQVRSRLGRVYLRDNEDDLLLPPHWTIRKLYERWCYECGWITNSVGGDSSYGKISQYVPRANDELWPDGSEATMVVSKATFRKIWLDRFKDVKIGKVAKDTCADCWEFKNQLKRLDMVAARRLNNDINGESIYEPFVEESTSSASSCNLESNTSIIFDSQNNEGEIGIAQEEIVAKMHTHVSSFKSQREFVQKRAKEVKEELSMDIIWPNNTVCLCGDYSQNLSLPHFGGEQPGDTYYFSPLSISCFGLVNHSTEILTAYVYPEGVGKKGGNNVASLIFKYLKDNGILNLAETKGTGKRLSLIFDNCAGQNKNRMVMRFGQYLVDRGIFNEVEIIFLITGHTKNICDRRFKDLKANYHRRNIYTFDQLIKVLKEGKAGEATNKYLDVHEIKANDFSNWDRYLDLLYKKSIPKISIYHYFSFTKGKLKMKTTVDSSAEEHKVLSNLKKKDTDETLQNWVNILETQFPVMVSTPGLAEIKQVELFTKWRPFVPEEFKNEICPEPPKAVLDKVKLEKKNKAIAKKKVVIEAIKEKEGNLSKESSNGCDC